jgi:hypothetical protein
LDYVLGVGGWHPVRIRERFTGCMYLVQLLRVHLDDAEHEGVEQALRAAARVTPEREWFDLRRL